MLQLATFAALASVAGCSSQGATAERQFNLKKENSTTPPGCSDYQAVADAYLRDENAKKYKEWKLSADIYCLNEQTERELRVS